jgi:CheY-like chemotaxis protein
MGRLEVWEKWPLQASLHGQTIFAFCSLCQAKSFAFISPVRLGSMRSGHRCGNFQPPHESAAYTRKSANPLLQSPSGVFVEVGILIIDDDIVSQRALKNVLDSEGWHVRIVPLASHAMVEIATGSWSLVIVNAALTDVHGPVFTTLRDLAQGQADAPDDAEIDAARPKRIRVLFLVPILAAKMIQPVLEKEGLPYSLKPYHLNEFLEKVGDLLVEAGALEVPIRSMDFTVRRRRNGSRSGRSARSGAMFASREDYQMSEEEMVEFERQEEEDRKKREKQQRDREHL